MKSHSLFALIGITLSIFIGCAHESLGSKRERLDGVVGCRLPVNPSDRLVIRIVTATTTNRFDVQVGPEGTINVPELGEIKAAGKDTIEIRTELDKRITQRSGITHVTVGWLDLFTSVSGSVKVPMRILWNRPLKATEAIAMAGGFNEDLSSWKKRRIRIRRDDGEIVTWDFLKATKDPRFDFELRRGDWVQVP